MEPVKDLYMLEWFLSKCDYMWHGDVLVDTALE